MTTTNQQKQRWRLTRPHPNLFVIFFKCRHCMCNTMCRLAEHYESPNQEFRKNAFSRAEFDAWYGPTYSDDWGGFNMPVSSLDPFFRGEFDPLSAEELPIINTLRHATAKNGGARKYLIAAPERSMGSLQHEMCHAIFFLDKKYRHRALKALADHETDLRTPLARRLASKRASLLVVGYTTGVLNDELIVFMIECKQLPFFNLYMECLTGNPAYSALLAMVEKS